MLIFCYFKFKDNFNKYTTSLKEESNQFKELVNTYKRLLGNTVTNNNFNTTVNSSVGNSITGNTKNLEKSNEKY